MTFILGMAVDFMSVCVPRLQTTRTDTGLKKRRYIRNAILHLSLLFIHPHNNNVKELFIYLHLHATHTPLCPTEKATTHPSTQTTTTTRRTNSFHRDSNPHPTPPPPHPHHPSSQPTRSPALLLAQLLPVQPLLVFTPRYTPPLSNRPTCPRTSTPNSTTTQSLLQVLPALYRSLQTSTPIAWRRR